MYHINLIVLYMILLTRSSQFQHDLHEAVTAELGGIKKIHGTFLHSVRTVCTAVVAVGSYIAAVSYMPHSFWVVVACTIVFAVTWAHLILLAHEAVHGVFSKQTWANAALVRVLNISGGSSYMYRKHHANHHAHTNIIERDTDVQFAPFIQMNPSDIWHWWYRFQHVYAPVLYALSGLYLIMNTDGFFRLPIQKKCGWLLSKCSHLIVFWLIPFWLLSPVFAAIVSIGSLLIIGAIIGLCVQVSHVFEDTQFMSDTSDDRHDWASLIIKTTANYDMHNPFMRWYCAGVTHHVIHSLYPSISSCHYHRILPVITDVVHKHGKTMHSFPTLTHMIVSHLKTLYRMGLKKI